MAATTAAGETVRGIRVNEDAFTIQIKDAGGRFHSFRKAELRELRRLTGETPMPAYRGRLTEGELDDLVAYLARLRGKS
jgi:cytochrome c1